MAEYIEREDMINSKPEGRNQEQPGKEEYNKGWNDCRRCFVRIIESQPTADVAPVIHAHWIRQDESFTRFKCSNPECGIENCSGFENYCPNCGAKMDEGKGDFIER